MGLSKITSCVSRRHFRRRPTASSPRNASASQNFDFGLENPPVGSDNEPLSRASTPSELDVDSLETSPQSDSPTDASHEDRLSSAGIAQTAPMALRVQPALVEVAVKEDGAAVAASASSTNEFDPDAAKIARIQKLLEPGQPLGDLSDFAKAYGDVAFCRRLLRKYNGDVQTCCAKYKYALRWREDKRELLTTRKFTQAGDLRVVGRDMAHRPLLYQCLKNQTLSGGQGLDQMAVRFVEAVELAEPLAENTVHMWDLHGLKLHLNLNPAPLVDMLKSTEGYFAERMYELVIIDLPGAANSMKNLIWPLVPERTRKKIRFATAAETISHLKKTCDPEVAQRIISVMGENRDKSLSLEQRKMTWKQINEHGDLVPAF